MKFSILIMILLSLPVHSVIYDKCDHNIDKIQLFYVNGMFTSADLYNKNIYYIDGFQRSYLDDYGYNGPVRGQYNDNEVWYEQIWEVSRQKAEDL